MKPNDNKRWGIVWRVNIAGLHYFPRCEIPLTSATLCTCLVFWGRTDILVIISSRPCDLANKSTVTCNSFRFNSDSGLSPCTIEKLLALAYYANAGTPISFAPLDRFLSLLFHFPQLTTHFFKRLEAT